VEIAQGKLSFVKPSSDVANYTFSVESNRKEPAEALKPEKHFFLVEKPEFDINLAKSPCFVVATLKDLTEVKEGDKLETIWESEDESRNFALIGYETVTPYGIMYSTSFTPAELKLEKKSKKGSNKGLIIGLAVGGALLLVVALVGGFFLWRRRRAGYSGLS